MRSVATNDCGHASPGLPSDSAGVKGGGGGVVADLQGL